MKILKTLDDIIETNIVLPIIYNFPWLFRKHYSQEWGKDLEKEALQLLSMTDKQMRRRFACMSDKEIADWLSNYKKIYDKKANQQ